MVVDTSAIFAILGDEPEKQVFGLAIAASPIRLVSAATAIEAALVAIGRRGEAGLAELQALISALDIETVAVTADQAKLAIEAFRRFGKGRHPAALNFGDCFSYALARATEEPLLFKGNDFARTDIEPALAP